MTDKYDAIFDAAGRQYDVDPALLKVIAKQESGYNPRARGPETKSGVAKGMMQLTDATAEALGVKDPDDPEQAIPAAAKLLSQHLDQFGNVADAAAAYYGGPNEKAWGPKTAAYREAITSAYGGQSGDDLETLAFGGKPKAAAASPKDDLEQDVFGGSDAAPADDDKLRFTSGDVKGQEITPAQAKTMTDLAKSRLLSHDAAEGTEAKPFVLRAGDDPAQIQGEDVYYIDQAGVLNKTPGPGDSKNHSAASRIGEGIEAGVGDVVQSGANAVSALMPGTENSLYAKGDYTTGLKGTERAYVARTRGDKLTGAGRLAGQVIASAPIMEGAGAGLLKLGAPRLLGPAGEFLAGNAGKASGAAIKAAGKAAPLTAKLANAGTRAASLAAKGSLEGVEAAALTSAASDEPLADQLKAGAVIGGALGPAGRLAGKLGERVVGSKLAGAASLAEQRAVQDAANGLPVPVPLTTGKITGSPAQQMAENLMLKGKRGDAAQKIMGGHADDVDAALKANIPAIQEKMAGAAPGANEGGIGASNKLNAAYDAAKKTVNDAYDLARSKAGGYLPAEERPVLNQQLREAVKDFPKTKIPGVSSVLDALDVGRTTQFTPEQVFEARSQLTNLRKFPDADGLAASKAVGALDAYLDNALKVDLISGDASAVKAWKAAIGKRREFGKLFEGNDLVQALTKREPRSGTMELKVSPEDAANYIFGANDIGFTTKKNFTRDITRLKNTLGADSPEWGALRAEAFGRLARSAGPSDKPFSGAAFKTAWSKAKDRSPQAVDALFTKDEQKLIDQLADIAQRATQPVKGGDNPSNSGVLLESAKKFMSPGTMLGAAGGSAAGPGGAAAGAAAGRAFEAFLKDIADVNAAKKAVRGELSAPKVLKPQHRLLGNVANKAAMAGSVKLLGAPGQ